MTNSIKKGQIWVIPADGKDNDSPGQMVIILAFDNSIAFVVPAHYYMEKRTFHDLILDTNLHSCFIPAPLVVMTSLTMCISANVFSEEKTCLTGDIYPEGFKLIEEKLQTVEKAEKHLANLRMKDSTGEIVTFEEDMTAVDAGAYDILPVNGDIDGYKQFYHSVFDILEPWHIMATAAMCEELMEDDCFQKVQKIINDLVVRIKKIYSEWHPVQIKLSGAGSRDDLPSSIPFSIDGIGNFAITFRNLDNRIKVTLEGSDTDNVLKCAPILTIVYLDGSEEQHVFSKDRISWFIPLKKSKISRIDIEFTKER